MEYLFFLEEIHFSFRLLGFLVQVFTFMPHVRVYDPGNQTGLLKIRLFVPSCVFHPVTFYRITNRYS